MIKSLDICTTADGKQYISVEDDNDGKDDEEFYMDYKEAFPEIVEKLRKFHDVK